MDFGNALQKLEMLRAGYEQFFVPGLPADRPFESKEEVIVLYGELEEVVTMLAGIGRVEVPSHPGHVLEYPNYIEATLLSDSSLFSHHGHTQLLKLIGKVRQLAEDPTVPRAEYSATDLIRVLRRFRECCQYVSNPPQSEPEVHEILWIILRSHFDRLEKEETLPRFGVKQYRPDFGIPHLRILVEAKFVGGKTDVSRIQDEIQGDVPGYLTSNTKYSAIVVFAYDQAQKLRDPTKFVEALKSIDGIIEVIVVPGIG